MKQIDIIRTYAQKRCLIVDDVPDIRASLKRMLTDFGCSDVDTAGNAEEAIDLCERNHYQILIADYNLGSGKNGQQLLEELRFHRLLRNTSLFIMITAENASHYVLHALEYQPDDYLSKPITRQGLRARLDQDLLRKETLTPVNECLDQNKPRKAIEACMQLMQEETRYKTDICKVLGELLCEVEDYPQALQLYSGLYNEKSPIWVQLGYAKALFGTKEIAKAKAALTKLIAESPLCVDAHELLAELLESQNQIEQAQHTMAQAVSLSPQSVNRQRELGRICKAAGDNVAALHAFRAALRHGKNSCHEAPADYISLADTLIHLGKNETGPTAKKYADEALEAVKQVEKKFSRHPIAKIHSKLVEAEVFDMLENTTAADQATEAAIAMLAAVTPSILNNSPIDFSISCAQALIERGKYDEGEKLLQAVAAINSDHDKAIKIDKLLREPLTSEGIEYASKLNKQGITRYQKKQYHEAVNAFTSVLRELPNHIGLNLNLIQALVSKAKSQALSQAELSLLDSSLLRIGEPEAESQHASRVNYLKKQIEKIKADTK
ncbi:tetratricopeptide repeat-containing response regulator [Saccharophagus degradans]|uniref:Response regulator n=1 Tax=Saccharophagus degradans TaxID=86304 RepID=A0AAW7X056_9GAMM|nr:tetratricopeptide repeat-containing response regulator [Saccharophagus degradans]MDO6421110.1 response regulator [Saccharophagus degradans]MDO6605979.1 response regulator [Saccharophagus degradans]